MALITDINTAGDSALRITSRSSRIQIFLNGDWNGSTISLQLNVAGSWYTVKEYDENSYDIVDVVGTVVYRFSTSGTPNIICDVSFDRSGGGQVE
jgi:hypothetical protein